MNIFGHASTNRSKSCRNNSLKQHGKAAKISKFEVVLLRQAYVRDVTALKAKSAGNLLSYPGLQDFPNKGHNDRGKVSSISRRDLHVTLTIHQRQVKQHHGLRSLDAII